MALLMTAFVVIILNPPHLLLNTTVGGGDTGGTLVAAHYVALHLLPHGQITGWSPWWFLGFPIYTFYFPLPAVATSLVGYVIGFNVASHLTLVAPAILLPGTMYAFGRLVRFASPVPELLSVAAVGYLLEPTWVVSGGNLMSLFVGEYSYSWAIIFALLAVAFIWRALNTGQYRVLSALLLAATMLSHVVLGLCVAVIGVVMFLVVGLASTLPSADRRSRLLPVVLASAVGALLSLWWLIPFTVYVPYANSVGWGKNVSYWILTMPGQPWLFVLAIVGVVGAVRRGQRLVKAIALSALVFAGLFIYLPQSSPIWNERFYPVYVLLVWILGALGAAYVLELLRPRLTRLRRPSLAKVPAIVLSALCGVFVLNGWASINWAPFGKAAKAVEYVTGGAWQHERTAVLYRSLSETALLGLENNPNHAVLLKIYATLETVMHRYGCGYFESEQMMPVWGTSYPWAELSLLTDGCLSAPSGAMLESSSTRPVIAQLEPIISYPYGVVYQQGISNGANENLNLGVPMMQALGIKYYVAYTAPTLRAAARQPDLKLIADGGGIWHVFLVLHSKETYVPRYQPVVLTGPGAANTNWALTGASYLKTSGANYLMFTQSGPAAWERARISALNAHGRSNVRIPTLVREPSSTVTHYVRTNNTISFTVSRVGVPVEVKTSWFPNWHVRGATGPYRSVPNFMVVVPTSHHVVLYYGTTTVDVAANAATYLGLLGLFPLGLLGRRRRRAWMVETRPRNRDGSPGTDETGEVDEGAGDSVAGLG